LTKENHNKFKVLFIDEAQDLSLLQWEMVRKIWGEAEKTYIAGDDDQAIFKWAGADVDHFIALKEEVDDIKNFRSIVSYTWWTYTRTITKDNRTSTE
jgi:ATP-dependent exoDNAse (exonuclease V) beta subunit